MTAIRAAAVAGSFYPADATVLRRQLDQFLAEADRMEGPVPKAVIAPHAGYVYSGPVAASAYARLAPARGTVSRVVLIGPSHRVAFRGLAVGSAEAWRTPLGEVPVDRPAVEALARLPMVATLDAAHAGEHSLEVHVPFLQMVLGTFKLVPVVAGDARPDEVAEVLDAVWGGAETVIVVSTDLSHYLDYRSCQEVDRATTAAIERFDANALISTRDCACGRVGVGGLLLAAQRRAMTITTLDVRNSGDTAGPRDRVVGYGSWALWETPAPGGAADGLGPILLELARASIRHGLAEGTPEPVAAAGLPEALGQPGAVFVTLKRGGALRGCIGSPIAWRTLAEDVVDNAFKAAFRDPRFPPLRPEELDGLALSVSLLTQPVPMAFVDEASLLAQLRPHIDGLIIEDAGRQALFLPAVWEQLSDRRQFLAHLKVKAGLSAEHWSPSLRASRFQAIEIKE